MLDPLARSVVQEMVSANAGEISKVRNAMNAGSASTISQVARRATVTQLGSSYCRDKQTAVDL